MLDPSAVQIHFADLQEEIVGGSATNPREAIGRAVRVLARLAGLLDIPVTVSAAPMPGGPRLIAEVPEAPVALRTGPSAWDDPAIQAAITGLRRPVLVVCGVVTEMVVLHTALDALAAGCTVHVAVDACGGLSARTEQVAFSRMEAAGAQLTSAASLAGDLVRDFASPVGQQALGAVFSG
jgi:Isochorismatase family